MTLQKRLDRLEAARGQTPDPQEATDFAEAVAALDRLAARKAAGDATVDGDLRALIEATRHGQA